MDKLVNRVTVVQGSGKTRAAKTVYDATAKDAPTNPTITIDPIVRSVTVVEGGETRVATTVHKSLHWADRKAGIQFDESLLRRFLKADMIRAQETYKQHLESASHDKAMWWLDLPANMVRAFLKADHQIRKSKRSQDIEVAVKDMQSDLRDLANDVQAAAYDARADIKGKASETKAKVKGN